MAMMAANSRTYSDGLILGPSCEKLAVRAKAYAPNVQIVRVVRRLIDQDATAIKVSAQSSIGQDELRKPNQVLAPVFVS